MAEIKTVAQFAPRGSEADKLLAYPFEAPAHSYITDGETVTELPDTFDEFSRQTDELLTAQGLPPMAERIAVIEYGSNASPYQAREKMAKFGPDSLQKELQTLPKIVATVQGADIVWHGKPGQKGSTFAGLFKDESTESTEAPCFVKIGRNVRYLRDDLECWLQSKRRFNTLEQVVEHYNSGVQPHPNLSPQLRLPDGSPRRLNLSPAQKAALVAFLKTLTDHALSTDVKFSDPFK